MLPQAIAEPLTPPRDARGFVVEPLSLAQLTAQQNVHVVWTAAGAVRGNHHHVRGTEVALVLGPALVRYRDANGIQDIEIAKGILYRFTFRPKSHMPSVLWGRSRCFSWGSTQRSTPPSIQTHSQTTYSERMTLPNS